MGFADEEEGALGTQDRLAGWGVGLLEHGQRRQVRAIQQDRSRGRGRRRQGIELARKQLGFGDLIGTGETTEKEGLLNPRTLPLTDQQYSTRFVLFLALWPVPLQLKRLGLF